VIYKVYDNILESEVPKYRWRTLFDIDRDTGVFSIWTPMVSFANYSIYVDASNLHTWGMGTNHSPLGKDPLKQEFPMINVTIIHVPTNMYFGPALTNALTDLQIMFDVSSGSQVMIEDNGALRVTGQRYVTYSLPFVFDPIEDEGVLVKVKDIYQMNYLQYDKDKMRFTFDLALMDRFDIGPHEVRVRVTDKLGKYYDFQWHFTLKGYDFSKQVAKDLRPMNDGLFKARIHSVDSKGLVKIWFEKNLTRQVPATARRAL
jgi:hypothetical protein